MASNLHFLVKRREPVLVAPAKPTPYEFKDLSDIDDQESLRFQVPVVQFYRNNPSSYGRDPAAVVKDALAKVLVFYYPLAGRLREGPGRKLTVECTGEGVLFIEADADVSLEQFGDAIQPPFPCWEELLYQVPGSDGITGCPLLLVQVTRLKCGGFILALRLNHTMADGPGLIQFMNAAAEIARGHPTPSVVPVWQRQLLNARDPPQVSFTHRKYDEVPDTKGTLLPVDDMIHRSFFFGPDEMSAIRKHLPPHLSDSTNFDVLTACLWRCRTIAIRPEPDEEVRFLCTVNTRGKGLALPSGYYGNAFSIPVAVTGAAKLCRNPLGYAVELVRKAKREVTGEYLRSVADFMVRHQRRHFAAVRAFIISDVTRAGFESVDFGWGEAVYGGPASGGAGPVPGVITFLVKFRNGKGQEGTVVPLFLPSPAMERFAVELRKKLSEQESNSIAFLAGSHRSILSAL